jgi:hypothetical protein
MGNCRGCPPAFFVIILAHACGYFRQSRESPEFIANRRQFHSLTRKLPTFGMKRWLGAIENPPAGSGFQPPKIDSYQLLYDKSGNRPLHLRGGDDPGDLNDEEDTQVVYNTANRPDHCALFPFQIEVFPLSHLSSSGVGQRGPAHSARGSWPARQASALARSWRGPRPVLRWSERGAGSICMARP